MIINICKIFAITPISRGGAIDLVFRTQLFLWEMHSLLKANLFEQLQRCKTFQHHWMNGKATIKINSFRSRQSSSHLPKCLAAIRAKCENNWVLWRSNHLTPACLCQHTNASQWPLIANNEGGNDGTEGDFCMKWKCWDWRRRKDIYLPTSTSALSAFPDSSYVEKGLFVSPSLDNNTSFPSDLGGHNIKTLCMMNVIHVRRER